MTHKKVNFAEHKLIPAILVSLISIFILQNDSFAFTIISNAGKPSHWPAGDVTYRFHTDTSGHFVGGVDSSGTVSDEFEPIRISFDSWVNIPGVNLNVTDLGFTSNFPSGSDRENTIIWIADNWRNLSFNPPSNALAVTILTFDSGSGQIEDGDIYFNAQNFNWAVVDDPSEVSYIDVQNIATHEIGHLLGLDHSSESIFESNLVLEEATMFFASTMGETARRTLRDDDIDGITSLYSQSLTATPTISSAVLIDESFNVATYEITGSNFSELTSFVITANDTQIYDAVARYRNINSDTHATAQFDLTSFPSGNAVLVAFNHPTELETYSLSVTGGGFAGTSRGGGGCQIIPTDDVVGFFLLFLSLFVVLLLLRSSFSRQPAKAHKKRARVH